MVIGTSNEDLKSFPINGLGTAGMPLKSDDLETRSWLADNDEEKGERERDWERDEGRAVS